jgi:hypothetical protein
MRKLVLGILVTCSAMCASCGALAAASVTSGSSSEAATTVTATTTSTTQTGAVGPVTDAQLEDIADNEAERFGEAQPTEIETVGGLHAGVAIFKLTGNETQVEDDNEAADVIQEHGSFTVPTAPQGVTPPTGHVLTIVVDAENREVRDVSLAEGSDPGPDISNLGVGQAVALP